MRSTPLTRIAAALLATLPALAAAQTATTYPNKPVHIVVPFAPGGTSDSLARLLGQKLTEVWGQPIIVENRAGADGNIGAQSVARSAPDGYTLMLLDTGTLTMAPVFYPKLPFDPIADFAPVTLLQFSPHALVAAPSVTAKTVKDLVALAKLRAGGLDFATSNNSARLAGAQFELATGAKILQVPYKGAAAAMGATMAGDVQITLNGLFIALPQIKGDKVKAVAVASERRMAATPDVPTMIESGYPGFVTGSWQGVLAPAHTPKDIVEKINGALVKILRSPEMGQRLSEQGAEVIASTPEQFAAFLKEDTAKNLKVAKAGDIKPD